jgi:hypothetical protein
MKRTSLTTAVIAGIAGVAGISNMASAVYLNSDGLGQVLFYPYYTVNGGNLTLLTVVNTTASGKAVKVRFLEAYNSREVLDFNLYLSPHDVWTAAVVKTANNAAGVFSTDNSCTVPPLQTSASLVGPGTGEFAADAYNGNIVTLPADGGPTGLSRTLEGYVELIEMATITNADDGSLDAITHKNGVPNDCGQVNDAWAGGYWTASAGAADTDSPTGGLFGSGSIINVAQGVIEGYNADAIDQFYVENDVPKHTEPESLAPGLNDGSSLTSYVFAPSPTTAVPTLVTTTYGRAVDAVSSLFMADQIYNEYWTGGGTAASSEWVVTFPTKRFYVDPPISHSATVLKPFDVLFSKTLGGTSCAPIGIAWYDREEKKPGGTVGFSPRPVFGNNLCWEAQVVTFNQGKAGSTILGSNLTANITTGYNNGWANIDLYGASPTQHNLPSTGANTYRGLPVTGFWVAQVVNGALNGVLSNYASLYRHKLHRVCSANGSACS